MTGRPRRRKEPWFPPADQADAEGLVAIGGDLSPQRLLAAYDRGIFPWYDEGLPPLWWSPDPRGVLEPADLYVSRTLTRTLRRGTFRFTWDHAFADVIRACAEDRAEGTWIIPDMRAAYERLFLLGHAHSAEVWKDDLLVGGLYGVHRGALFAAESMFHRATDASKAALAVAVRSLARAGIELVDVQFVTPHLASMGAKAMPRSVYLRRAAELVSRPVQLRGLSLLP
jgi:leucyl/phenylalanyl-tRNA---protein transferase